MMAKNVADEVASTGVQVNACGTNFMDFPEFRKAAGADDPERRKFIEAQVPMGRLGTMEESINGKLELLAEADSAARAFDRRITQVQASYLDETKHVLIVTSGGACVWDVRPLVRLSVTVIVEHKGRREAGSGGGGGRWALERFDDADAWLADAGQTDELRALRGQGVPVFFTVAVTVTTSPAFTFCGACSDTSRFAAPASATGARAFMPTGVIVGSSGVILRTTNGGTTWKTQNSGTLQTLWEVQLVRGTQGGVLFAAGYGGTLIASGVSPLPVKTWTGAFDSSWTNAGNWSPTGVPEKLDSVIIPVTANKPVLRVTVQQVNVAALRVAVGQKLTVGSGVAEFAVKRSINIDGALEVEPQSTTHFVVGENFVVANGAAFTPGASTVIFTNPGSIRGTFNTVVMAESAHVRTLGNVSIGNYLLILSDLTIRAADTPSVAGQ